MKGILRAALLVVLGGAVAILTAGCLFGVPGVEVGVMDINPVNNNGMIFDPLANGMPLHYNGSFLSGDKIVLDYNAGINQYSERYGVSDSRIQIFEVEIQCSEKNVQDTVYWPYSYDNNVCVWSVLWDGPIDSRTGLPFTMVPLSLQPDFGDRPVYPYNTCEPHINEAVPAGTAEITSSGRYNWIEVEIGPMPYADGTYYVDNRIKQVEKSMITAKVTEAGKIIVTWISDNGKKSEDFTLKVKEDWFWVYGRSVVNVGACVDCLRLSPFMIP